MNITEFWGKILSDIDFILNPRLHIWESYISDLGMQAITQQLRSTMAGAAWEDNPNGVNHGSIVSVETSNNQAVIDSYYDVQAGDTMVAVVNGIFVSFSILLVNGKTLTLDKTTGLATGVFIRFVPASVPEFGDVKHSAVKRGRSFYFPTEKKISKVTISHARLNQLGMATPNIEANVFNTVRESTEAISQHLRDIDVWLWYQFLPAAFNAPKNALPVTLAAPIADTTNYIPTADELFKIIHKMIDHARINGFDFAEARLFVPNQWDDIMKKEDKISQFERRDLYDGAIGSRVTRLLAHNVTLMWTPSLYLDGTNICYLMDTRAFSFLTTTDGMFRLRDNNVPVMGDYYMNLIISDFAPYFIGLGVGVRGMLTSDGNVPSTFTLAKTGQESQNLLQGQDAVAKSSIDAMITAIDKEIKEKRAEIDKQLTKITDQEKITAKEAEYQHFVDAKNETLATLKKLRG